ILFQVRLRRPIEVSRNLSGFVDSLVEVAQHISAREAGYGVRDHDRHQSLQYFGLTKYDVGGPLALKTSPVVLGRITREDLLVNRIQLWGETIQQVRPVGFQLPVHPLLSALKVLNP